MHRKFEQVGQLTRRGFVRAAGLGALAMSGMWLVGCGGTSDSGESSGSSTSGEGGSGKTVNIAMSTPVESLDPVVAGDGTSMVVISNCNEGLFVTDVDGNPVNGLCESYEVTDDQLTYTFHLRDQKWSNGDSVTAQDFVYSWHRNALGDANSALFQYQLEMAGFKNATAVINGEMDVDELGAHATDDKTIVVELDHPVPFLFNLFAFTPFGPVQQAFREEKGDNFGLTKDDMLWNGPYTLTGYDTASNIVTLTKNPDYWDAENVDIDVINLQVIADTQQAVMSYENGDVDYVKLTSDLVQQYKDDPAFSSTGGIFNYYLMVNTKESGLDSLNLRQAIAYAINRPDICDNVLKDGSLPVYQMCMNGLWANENGDDFAQSSPQFFEYDPDKAKELWAAAQQETDRREIKIVYDQEVDFCKSVAEYLQSTLQSTLEGLTVNIESTPKKNRIQMQADHDYEITLHRWGPDYADATAILAMYQSDDASNYSQWNSPEFDELYDKANSTDAGDAAARWDDLMQCNSICTENAVCIPIFQEGLSKLTRPTLKGKTDHITGIECYYKFCTLDA